MEKWCKEVNLFVNASKTEMILFTKRKKIEGFKNPHIFGNELHLTKQVKYLGIIIDDRLTWKPHVDNKTQKSIRSFWQCRRAFGKTWGLSSKIIMWIYSLRWFDVFELICNRQKNDPC